MKIKTIKRTTPVVLITLPNEGQVTFFNSENTSLIFLPTRTNQLGLSDFFLGFSVFTVSFAMIFLRNAPPSLFEGNRSPSLIILLGLFVRRMLLAERTVLVDRQSVGIVLLIFKRIVISVLAFRTLERDLRSCGFSSHIEKTPYKKITPLFQVLVGILAHERGFVNLFSSVFIRFLIFYPFFCKIGAVPASACALSPPSESRLSKFSSRNRPSANESANLKLRSFARRKSLFASYAFSFL